MRTRQQTNNVESEANFVKILETLAKRTRKVSNFAMKWL